MLGLSTNMAANASPTAGATSVTGTIQPSDVADALPLGLRSSYTFDKDTLFLVIPEPYSLLLQTSGSWGSSKGKIVGYARHPEEEPFNFVLIVTVSHLNSNDVFGNEELAKEVNSQLVRNAGPAPVIHRY